MASSRDLPGLGASLPQSRWWHCLHAEPAACIRLWCFPGIGSGTATWRAWVPPLVGAGDLIAVSLPGREARLNEAAVTRMHDLASAATVEMAPHIDERAVFCGHGFGALLAFEVARQLRAARAPGPRGLVCCGARPPHARRIYPPLHHLSPRPFLAAVEHRYGPIPLFRDHPEFLELLLPSLRADLEALETYRFTAESALDLAILALAGTHDPLVAEAALNGWQRHTTGRFESSRLPGRHFITTENPIATAQRVRLFLATL